MRLKEFFYIQKSDRQVLIALLCVIAVALLLFYGLGSNSDEPPIAAADSLSFQQDSVAPSYSPRRTHAYHRQRSYVNYDEETAAAPELFPFDPNTADTTQLLRLGLKPWMVRNVLKYRSSGGIFRRKEDFARLYGLTVKQYKQLEPYIRISDDYKPAASLYAPETTKDTVARTRKLTPGQHVVLNTADTTQLKTIPGIGSYRARTIYGYGQRLGGYVNVDQVMEIEDMPAEVLDFLTVENPKVKTLNLNKLSLAELRRHPYIRQLRARAIVDYRRLHGPLKSLNDLRLLDVFTPDDIERLRPYVEF